MEKALNSLRSGLLIFFVNENWGIGDRGIAS